MTTARSDWSNSRGCCPTSPRGWYGKRWTATTRRGRRVGGAAAGLPMVPSRLRRRKQRRAGRYGGAADRHAGRAPRLRAEQRAGGRRPPWRYEAACGGHPDRDGCHGGDFGAEGGTELPAGAATSPAKVHAADRTAAGPGIATSAPKVGGGSQPAAHRSGRLVTPATALPQPRGRGRAIPAAVRRQVWERDRGCCSYVDRGRGAGAAPGNNAGNRSYRMRSAAASSPTISGRRRTRGRPPAGPELPHGRRLLPRPPSPARSSPSRQPALSRLPFRVLRRNQGAAAADRRWGLKDLVGHDCGRRIGLRGPMSTLTGRADDHAGDGPGTRSGRPG